MSEKLYYNWDQYTIDIKRIVDNYEFDSVVALYRGSLPIATHLTNVTDATMSVIKYQSYSKDQKQHKNTKEPVWLYNGMTEPNKKVLVVDDIYDSGSTMRRCKEFIGDVGWDVTYLTIFGRANSDGVEYLREREDRWIVFPWEII